MKSAIDDLRYTVRDLARRPGFTFAALLILTAGVGANSAIFSFVDALLLRPLSLGAHGERAVSLHSTHPSQPRDWEDSPVAWADLQDLRGTRSLEDAGGYVGRSFTLLAEGEAERVRGGSVTPNLFGLLGFEPALGARSADVVRLVVRRGAGLALLGSAIELLLALCLGRLLNAVLHGVGPFDPMALGGMAVLPLAVSIAASLLPARRAASVDPMTALRVE